MVFETEPITFGDNAVLAESIRLWVESQDSAVTVRRVFYAMVTAGELDNTMAQYKRVSRVTTDLRRGGYLDWNRIEDTTRGAHKRPDYRNAHHCLTAALDSFRLDRWADQLVYVQVWCEKRGHISVLYPTTDALDVTIVECGGRRALNQETVEPFLRRPGKRAVVLYVGDYDPTGLQIDDNLQRQLGEWGVHVEWKRVALTPEQQSHYMRRYVVPDKATDKWLAQHPNVEIIGYSPSGDPLVNKLEKDPNAQWFRDRHDGELFQVEVDAMPTDDLRLVVAGAIGELLNLDMYNRRVDEENRQRVGYRTVIGESFVGDDE